MPARCTRSATGPRPSRCCLSSSGSCRAGACGRGCSSASTPPAAGRWLQIMGPAGEDGLDLSQDARVLVSRLAAGQRLSHDFGEGRGGYAYLIAGTAMLGDEKLDAGDAAKARGRHNLAVQADADSELILIDVSLDSRPVGVWAHS